MISRRKLLLQALAAGLAAKLAEGDALAASPNLAPTHDAAQEPIDRRALVGRHNVVRTASNAGSPLQVGNGGFAFGADITGLQTFVPFNTMSDWGWFSFPLPPGQTPADFHGETWDAHGRPVVYASSDPLDPAITQWLFYNPFRLNLGRIGLRLMLTSGAEATEADLTDCRQELDLWTGTLRSQFRLDGEAVAVETACDPDSDTVAVRIVSPLVATRRLTVFLDFPYPDHKDFATYVGDWNSPDKHQTSAKMGARTADIEHRIDTVIHHIGVTWNDSAQFAHSVPDENPPTLVITSAQYGAAGHFADVTALLNAAIHHNALSFLVTNDTLGGDPALDYPKALTVTYTLGGQTQHQQVGENGTLTLGPVSHAHRFTLTGDTSGRLDFSCTFAPDHAVKHVPDPDAVFASSERFWPSYWHSGAAIDLSQSRDPRWQELERRVVLSQYLMRVNEAGPYPPQESGLVNNGWSGKFHMEMYLWHGAHWALWNRWPELARSLGIYDKFLPSSRQLAAQQGYAGARWPKMTNPNGQESPYITNALLVWQQPHPMFFAELDYRAHPTRATLEKWRDVLFADADFLASYAFWDAPTKRYVLGPPMAIVSENTDDHITTNPTFELTQWKFGLRIAQQWRTRLGLAPDPTWAKVLAGLAPPPVQDGVYVTYEGIPNMWTHYNFEHPGLIGAYGLLPGDGIDIPTMRATAAKVAAVWQFNATWGWDFPMLAMNAARLGEPAQAVDYLLYPGSQFNFDDAGLASGGPYPYFPSNGGLLYAIALLAAGWDGAPHHPAPGFPTDGSWLVKAEGFARAI